MLASELLDKAAAHLDRVGLYQGGHYYAQGMYTEVAPCCAVGAVMVGTAVNGAIRYDSETVAANSILTDWLQANGIFTSIIGWSDSAPDKETVVNGLRGAAALARQREAA